MRVFLICWATIIALWLLDNVAKMEGVPHAVMVGVAFVAGVISYFSLSDWSEEWLWRNGYRPNAAGLIDAAKNCFRPAQ